MSKRYLGKEKSLREEIVTDDINMFYDYYIESGDTLYDIAKKNDIDVSMLAQINGLDVYDYLYPGQMIIIPKKGVKLYITKESDTLDKIARENSTTQENLLKSNSTIYLLPEQLLLYRE